MKRVTLIFVLMLMVSIGKAQLTSRKNKFYDRIEYYDSYRNMVGYSKKNPLDGSIEYYDPYGAVLRFKKKARPFKKQGQLYGTEKYDPFKRTEVALLRKERSSRLKDRNEKAKIESSLSMDKLPLSVFAPVVTYRKWNTLHQRYDIFDDKGKKIGHFRYKDSTRKWEYVESEY